MIRLLRKPFPLTDEDIIELALKSVKEYARQHKECNFDVEDCVKCAVDAVETVWKSVRTPGWILKPWQVSELKEIAGRIKPQLEHRARALAYKCLRKQKIESFKITAYEAQITSELRARGYRFLYVWQKSKVLVTIRISDTLACTKEIKYSDIKQGLLPGLIADMAEAVDLLKGQDLRVNVWMMSAEWQASAKWTV